ncbi:hypothetical protein SMKI_15G1860 [Saccharomyces mikatae IFO 1815]|uniref:BZIP domain-containing protein n=1 Tax=Saccharomyces mikatae IFO 1815 TaxID=226126 RepID=A0AA35ND63_SACMI|nr:uncharacterized protein SMKI_15G1860 [Saccharomyces mikatae IFO 1815]CAI4036345.1 hypothetical protein SMKI_15G1860 [Saccharomyces mikatae IFO 1815]
MLMQMKMDNHPLNFQSVLVSHPMTRDSTRPKKMMDNSFIPSPPAVLIKDENKADLRAISVVASNVTLPQIQLPKIVTLEEPGYESRNSPVTNLSTRRNSVNIGVLCEDVPNTVGPHIPRPVAMNNLIPPSLPKLNSYQLRPQLPDAHLNYHFNSNQYTPASHIPCEPAYTTASTFTNHPVASYFPSNSTPTTRKNSVTTNSLSEGGRRDSISLSEQVFNEGERYNNDGLLIGKTGKPLRNTKRAAQNRSAQKAFRQRREKYIKNLEEKSKLFDSLVEENSELKKMVESLKSKLKK